MVVLHTRTGQWLGPLVQLSLCARGLGALAEFSRDPVSL